MNTSPHPLVVVTGPTAGLGYYTTESLARAGARVVLAARSVSRAERTAAGIRERVPDADLTILELDLASLASVREAAGALTALGPIDALVNNAGVVSARRRGETVDGHETMFGTNHLGHFALTALLWPQIAPGGRVVHLGSIAHRFVRLDETDLENRRYRSFRSYCRSKLAVMLTGFELAARLREAGDSRSSTVVHPGYAVDELSSPRSALPDAQAGTALSRLIHGAFAHGKDAGARPSVVAALGDDVRSGDFLGPSGWQQLRGRPVPLIAYPHAYDRQAASSLWRASERMTGIRFDVN
ncbi:SDR family NAD(P)-dependent oxidoreductase [Microbacteriaceae bacterium VKM Ac-2855]|nr:SDR family NAD(P)-dependent oxidoreductase [Microbacteriaceae bacterium VKM Ac-2855]